MIMIKNWNDQDIELAIDYFLLNIMYPDIRAFLALKLALVAST